MSSILSSGDVLMWDGKKMKWVNLNLNPEQKKRERKKKLKRIKDGI